MNYVHRIGCTARIGKKGKAITLLSPSGSQSMKGLSEIHGHVEFTEIEGFDPKVYAPLDKKLCSKGRTPVR